MKAFYDEKTKKHLKKCNDCKKIKEVGSFYKNRTTNDGLQSECRECCRVRGRKLYLKNREDKREENCKKSIEWFNSRKTSLRVFVKVAYQTICRRVNKIKPSHPQYYGMFLCPREDFERFALNNKRLKVLYKNWQKSGYQFKLIPSVDRINPNKGYELNNIQFLTLSDNSKKKGTDGRGNYRTV